MDDMLFGVDSHFTLDSGRSIQLSQLHQELTYLGLLAGVPTTEYNDRLIQNHTNQARRYCLGDSNPVVIPPVRRTDFPAEVIAYQAEFGFAPPEALPPLVCIGVFKGDELPDSDQVFSRLVVVWYQTKYGLPTDRRLLAQLSALDWDAHATGYDL